MATDPAPVNDDLIAEASADEAVRAAARDLILASIRKASHLLVHGTPDRQDKIISMFAGPAIKEVLAPNKRDESTVMDEFHELRRAMLGGDETTTSADATDD